MGFDHDDRTMLKDVHTTGLENRVLLGTYEDRIKGLEAENKTLHGRITRTQISLASIGTLFTGVFGWLKMKTGG